MPPGHPTRRRRTDHDRDQGVDVRYSPVFSVRETDPAKDFRDRDVEGSDAGVEVPMPIAVEGIHPLRGDCAVAYTAQGIAIGTHQCRNERAHHLPKRFRRCGLQLCSFNSWAPAIWALWALAIARSPASRLWKVSRTNHAMAALRSGRSCPPIRGPGARHTILVDSTMLFPLWGMRLAVSAAKNRQAASAMKAVV